MGKNILQAQIHNLYFINQASLELFLFTVFVFVIKLSQEKLQYLFINFPYQIFMLSRVYLNKFIKSKSKFLRLFYREA